MKLIYKYIAKKFWGPFFFSTAVFAVFVFLADLFDHLKYFTNTTASFADIIQYFLMIIPFWTMVILPVAALLAGLFALSDTIHHGEWTAALAGGYEKRQLYMPIIVCACIVAGVNFILQETVSPALHKKADMIFQTKIKGKDYSANLIKKDIVIKTSENTFLTAKTLNVKTGIMEGVSFQEYFKGGLLTQITAQKAVWNSAAKLWYFNNAVIRNFSDKNEFSERQFDTTESNIDIEPSNLIMGKIWPEDLTIRDILKRVKVFKKTSVPINRELTYLYVKLAAPFAAVIMCMLAIPFAVSLKKSGRIINFAVAIFIAFFFWWIISVFQSAGEAGIISPVFAGWTPIIIFLSVSLWGLKKAGK